MSSSRRDPPGSVERLEKAPLAPLPRRSRGNLQCFPSQATTALSWVCTARAATGWGTRARPWRKERPARTHSPSRAGKRGGRRVPAPTAKTAREGEAGPATSAPRETAESPKPLRLAPFSLPLPSQERSRGCFNSLPGFFIFFFLLFPGALGIQVKRSSTSATSQAAGRSTAKPRTCGRT